MGATNISITVKGNEDAVRKAFKQKVKNDLYDHGHDPYNGSFTTFDGLEIKSVILNSVEDAHEYLEDKQQKWGPAFAVRYKRIKPNKTMNNLAGAIMKMEMENWNRNTTSRKRASNEKKIAEKRTKLYAWREKIAAKVKRTMWLVGGWAAC